MRGLLVTTRTVPEWYQVTQVLTKETSKVIGHGDRV